MLVQRVAMPASRVESWTVLGGDDAPVGPIERYLAYLSAIEPACAVPGCVRPERKRGMCLSHRQRWMAAGKPDIGEFVGRPGPTGTGTAPWDLV